VLQKSLREGFGLTVAEGLWKNRPVIGGNVGGIPLQIQDGRTGYLVETIEACTSRSLDILRHPDKAKAIAERGREHVRHNFLSTANLRNYLRLFNELAGNPLTEASEIHAAFVRT
jgi:trehalose synthase